MSSTTPAPLTAETASQAVTTPFVQREECKSIYDLVSAIVGSEGRSSSVEILASDAADPRFTSCQPSGWNQRSALDRFQFSPAVCPRGWTYHSVKPTSTTFSTLEYSIYTTAYCCASGHEIWRAISDFPVSSLPTPCYRSVEAGETTITAMISHGIGPTRVFTEGYMIHEPWMISWAESDTATLSPSLPSLGSTQSLSTWIPGETVPPPPKHTNQNDMPGIANFFLFIEIGIPIIGTAIIACSIWGCIACRRSRRREELRLQQTARESATRDGG